MANPIFIGASGTVVALDRDSGGILWEASLKGSDFVNVVTHGSDLYASSRGRLYRIDPATGTVLWRNELSGLGWGIVTIAGAAQAPAGAEKHRRDAAAAAAAASA